jgi:cell division transport system permease protein
MQRSLTRKKFGHYPFVGVILSSTLALIVAGLLGLLIIYAIRFEQLVREQVRLQVYLKNGLTESQRLQLEKRLESLPYINREVPIQFISKEESAKAFIAQTGEDFTRLLGENPLRDAYLVSILPEYHSKEKLRIVQQEIEKLNGVFQVFYLQELIEAINENAARIGLLLSGLFIIFLLSVVVLINNTIRLALFSQRFLIRSMQLVGATSAFIMRPFLLRALLYGFVAGTLASSVLYILESYGRRQVPDLTQLQVPEHTFILFAALAVLGMLIAFFSTFFSIRKYLNMSLDELY